MVCVRLLSSWPAQLELQGSCVHLRHSGYFLWSFQQSENSTLLVEHFRLYIQLCRCHWAFIVTSQHSFYPHPSRQQAFFIGLTLWETNEIILFYRLRVNLFLLFRFPFFSSKNDYTLFIMCVCEGVWMEARGQFMRVGSLIPLGGSWAWAQAIRFDGKHLHLRSQLSFIL